MLIRGKLDTSYEYILSVTARRLQIIFSKFRDLVDISILQNFTSSVLGFWI